MNATTLYCATNRSSDIIGNQVIMTQSMMHVWLDHCTPCNDSLTSLEP